jgi:hypothetical protein
MFLAGGIELNKLYLLISVALLLGIVILPASCQDSIGPPGSGMPSSSSTSGGTNIQITTSRNYDSGSSFSTFGGASAYPHKSSVQIGKRYEVPDPMAPPVLGPQEIASGTSTRLIINPEIEISNMFYVNNIPRTVSSCRLGEEVPIFLDIRNNGRLYSYEWYPDGKLHTQDIGNVAYSGIKEQSFSGDSRGLHALQYYCNGWSNYIYIYVV